jgi:hypothetical protein
VVTRKSYRKSLGHYTDQARRIGSSNFSAFNQPIRTPRAIANVIMQVDVNSRYELSLSMIWCQQPLRLWCGSKLET